MNRGSINTFLLRRHVTPGTAMASVYVREFVLRAKLLLSTCDYRGDCLDTGCQKARRTHCGRGSLSSGLPFIRHFQSRSKRQERRTEANKVRKRALETHPNHLLLLSSALFLI